MIDVDPLRYARQIRLPQIGPDGQRELADAAVLVIGAGGLGSPALHHLVASGVGTIGVVDFDTVDITNLHRQTLYALSDVGLSKTEAAGRRLRSVNPDVDVRLHPVRLTTTNAMMLIEPYDIVLDGSDTFSTRYAVNEASVRTKTPNVFASVDQFSGQASVFGTETGPCYRCLFPEPPPPGLIPNCEEGGVLGVVPSLLGTLQATEALKLILGIGSPLIGRLLLADTLSLTFREILVERDPQCPTCGEGKDSAPDAAPEIEPVTLKQILADDEPVTLLDVRTERERRERSLGGLHVPLAEIEDRLNEFRNIDTRLVVYCQSGARSSSAAALLQSRGISACSLTGGLNAWFKVNQ